MRVLQINSVCGVGSTGRICTDLADTLAANGHECLIAFGREAAPVKFSKYGFRICSDLDVRLDGLRTRIFDSAGFGNRKSTKLLIKKIEDWNPDVIHLHNLHGYYLNVEVLFNYLKKTNIPIVWTLHDCWAFTGHCVYFDYVGCDKWKTGCHHCPQKSIYPASFVMDNSRGNYQQKKKLFTSVNNMTIVTPSRWLASLVEQSFLAKYPVQVIHNGIDLNVFKPTPSAFRKQYGLEEKHIILGAANKWDKRKGLDSFVRLSEMLDEGYQIILVGPTKAQIKALPAKIIGIERTNSVMELAEIYSAADVFVNPTLEDNFPTTNLESLACGTPVITYNTGGSPECVNEEVGIVVEKGNVAALRDAIECIAMNKRFDSARCVEWAKLNFDKTEQYKEYVITYQAGLGL